MTTYQGGKKRLGKQIYKVIKEVENQLCDEKIPYFEPFCGMIGVGINFVREEERRKIRFCDLNGDLIEMWKGFQGGWKPKPVCSKEQYEKLKHSKSPSKERGFYGITCSFNAMFFKGYRSIIKQTGHEPLKNGLNGISKYIHDMKGKNVRFLKSRTYNKFKPKNILIYCDPPYKGNKLSNVDFTTFNHSEFWETMRRWSKDNIVVVSELVAPSDFKCIWEYKYNINFTNQHNTKITKKYTEKLFIHESHYKKLKGF